MVDKLVIDEFICGMGVGVLIFGIVIKKCKVKKEVLFVFCIILVQGLNCQICCMCEYFGYEVMKFECMWIMNVSLMGIFLGEWCDLIDDELIDLFKLIENFFFEVKLKVRLKVKVVIFGIKCLVVKMENSNDKGCLVGNGKCFIQLGCKKKGC